MPQQPSSRHAPVSYAELIERQAFEPPRPDLERQIEQLRLQLELQQTRAALRELQARP